MSSISPTVNEYSLGSDVHLDGRRASPSFLKEWYSCPFKWFMGYLAPHPEHQDTHGLATVGATATPLLMGSIWHDLMFGFRWSGWRDGVDTGEYSAEAAVEYAQAQASTRAGEWESAEASTTSMDLLVSMFHEYVASRGPDDWRMLGDGNGVPLVEREFTTPIGPDDRYEVIVKPDAVARTGAGLVVCPEYKTASARFLGMSMRNNRVGPQAHAENLVMHRHCPADRFDGVMFEYAVKDRGKKSELPRFQPDVVSMTEAELALWEAGTVRTMDEIAAASANWRELVAGGADPMVAAHHLFPMSGKATEQCWAFNRECDCFTWCHGGHEIGPGALRRYVPKRRR